MAANFVFRNVTDTAYISLQDLGAVAPTIDISPVQLIVKNEGDRVGVNCSIKIVADVDFEGSGINSIFVSSALNPVPGNYLINFDSPTSGTVNGSGTTFISDGSTKNSNIIPGIDIVFNDDIVSGMSGTVLVNDGYTQVRVYDATTVSNANKIDYARIFCPSMTTVAASLVLGGVLGVTTYYYVVTAVTSKGESLISNRLSIYNPGPNNSVQLTWNPYPGALSYNIYRSSVSGSEKLLTNLSATSFLDDGTLSINNSISYPTSTNIHKNDFWVQVLAPSGTIDYSIPRKFKLRAIGISS